VSSSVTGDKPARETTVSVKATLGVDLKFPGGCNIAGR
jgi:hypothetical protein